MKQSNNNNWCSLNIKEKIAIISAIAAFVAGWGLSIAAFIVPPVGEISDGILWILGQSLVYASSVFGITSYFSTETIRMKRDLRHYMDNAISSRHSNYEETTFDDNNDDNTPMDDGRY